jgi:hypothetical protein
VGRGECFAEGQSPFQFFHSLPTPKIIEPLFFAPMEIQ